MRFELGHVPMADGYGEALLPLAECKAHLSLEPDETEFDDLIEVFRDAAVEFVERFCSVKLGPTEGMTWSAQGLPSAACATVSLGVWPVTSIDEVAWLDSDGAEVDGDPADYRVTVKGVMRPVIGGQWPSGVGGDVVVTFSAGFAASEAPRSLLQAARMFMAHLFENRAAVITGVISGEIPLGVKSLCVPFRPMLI